MTPALAKRRDELAEKHSAIIGRLRFAFDEKPSLSTVGGYAGHDYRIGFDACAKIHEDVVAAAKSILADNRLMNAMSKEQARGLMYALAALESSRVEGDGG